MVGVYPMTSESEPIAENNSTDDTSGKPDIQTSDTNPNVPPASSASGPPPTKAHCEITCKPEKDWWDKFKPFVELAGVLILGVYTGYTIKIYWANHDAAIAAQNTLCEIQKQTTLMRQEMEENNAAVVILEKPSFNLFPDPNLSVELTNVGHYGASQLNATLSISYRSLSTGKQLGSTQEFKIGPLTIAAPPVT